MARCSSLIFELAVWERRQKFWGAMIRLFSGAVGLIGEAGGSWWRAV